MNKERLDILLANGSITQEEYNEMISKFEGNNVPEKGLEETNSPALTNEFDEAKLEKLIQAKVDKITSKLGKEKAELQKELERLKREKLSDDEIKKLDDIEREKALAEREQAILDRENRWYAIQAIKAAGLDDGSEDSLELVDFVMGSDESAIDAKVKVFAKVINKFVAAGMNKRYKDMGRTPNGGSSSGSGSNNPFSKEHFNLTQQMQIMRDNPELAKQLQAAAK